jgi:transposase
MQYIGIDIHRKFSLVHVMEKDGCKVECKRLEHDDVLGVREFFERYPDSSAALEATVGWMWLAEELESLGIDVHLAHSSGVSLIAGSRLKTDKVDAKALADLLRTNFLPEAYLAPLDVRVRREILRYRMALVKVRTMVKNRVHALLIRLNIHPKATDIFGKKSFEMLRALQIEEPYYTVLQGWLDLIEFLNSQVKSVETAIKKALSDDARTKYLTTLPGVGLITAYTIISEVGEIGRFRSEKAFASYCGLVPSTRQSASKTHHGRIGPGRRTLKWCIVEACHTAVRKDSYFATLFQKHKRSKGNGKALVIVAHQMAKIIYRLLSEERGYIPRPKQRNKNFEVGPRLTMVS